MSKELGAIQEEESLRRSKQIQLCMQTQRQWLSQAENALRRELRLPDNATYAEHQRAMEEERLRKQELRRRSNETFDQSASE